MTQSPPSPAQAESLAGAAKHNTRAIIAMLVAMSGFIINDTCVKLAGETLPLGMVVLVRGVMACALMIVLALALGQWRPIPREARKPLGARVVGEIGCTFLYLTALMAMPLANATAILQAMPLVMTIAAATFLRERVGWQRWAAVAAGLVGMLMVVQPGMAGFDANALIAISALAFMAVRDLSNRFIPRSAPTIMVAFTTMLAVTIMGGVLVAIDGVERLPNAREMLYLTGSACFLTLAFYFITDAMRTGELSVVAPFRYSIIVWAFILGYVVWGDVPGLLRSAGIALIVSSGLFILYREQVRRRRARA